MDKPQETPGQESMPDTGAPLDASQKHQLDDVLESFIQPKKEPSTLDPAEQEAFLNENPDRDFEEAEPEGEVEADEEDYEDTPALLEEEEEVGEPQAQGEAAEEDAQDDPIAALRAEIAQLRAQLKGTSEPEEEDSKDPSFEIDGSSFLTEEEAEALYSDPHSVLSRVLARVYAKAREDTYRDIPSLVENASLRQQALREARTKFWSQNPDLLKVIKENTSAQGFLRSTADQVQSENPSWSLERIFEETGKRVRAALNMSDLAKKTEKSVKPSGPPRRPRGVRRGVEEDVRSGLQKQIDSLIQGI